MTSMETVFLNDPWWLILIKVVGVFVLLLTWTIFNVWFERRVLGKMQNRKGPIMNGPLGLGQALGDGVKLLFKEDFRPARTDALVFNIAPMLTAVAAFASWSVIPLGGPVRMFGIETRLQLTDLPVAALLVMAIAGVGIYGFVLAGWSSNGTYSLLGRARHRAGDQLQIAMGLSWSPSSCTRGRCRPARSSRLRRSRSICSAPRSVAELVRPAAVAEFRHLLRFDVRRDQPSAVRHARMRSELVSGHITDYSGFRYALLPRRVHQRRDRFGSVVTLFLGGFHAPWPLNGTFLDQGWWTMLWFVLKVQIMIFTVAWVRAAVPRVRYDQMMKLGWKVLIPANLAWIVLLALVRGASVHGWWADPIFIGILIVFLAAVVAAIWFSGPEPQPEAEPIDLDAEFDAFAGGYPVPPMPGQKLITAVVAEGTAEPAGATASSARRAATSNGAEL